MGFDEKSEWPRSEEELKKSLLLQAALLLVRYRLWKSEYRLNVLLAILSIEFYSHYEHSKLTSWLLLLIRNNRKALFLSNNENFLVLEVVFE